MKTQNSKIETEDKKLDVYIPSIRIIVIIFFIIGILIGYAIGYMAGVSWALNWGVNKAVYFLELKGYDVDFNIPMIAAALYQYKNQVGTCFPDIETNEKVSFEDSRLSAYFPLSEFESSKLGEVYKNGN